MVLDGSSTETDPGPPERRASGSQSKLNLNVAGGQNDDPEAVLLRAHPEKAGSLEKTFMLGKAEAAGREEDQYEVV